MQRDLIGPLLGAVELSPGPQGGVAFPLNALYPVNRQDRVRSRPHPDFEENRKPCEDD